MDEQSPIADNTEKHLITSKTGKENDSSVKVYLKALELNTIVISGPTIHTSQTKKSKGGDHVLHQKSTQEVAIEGKATWQGIVYLFGY